MGKKEKAENTATEEKTDKKVLKVDRQEVVDLFKKLEYKDAESWGDDKIEAKIQKLSKVVDDDTDVEGAAGKLLKSLLTAVKDETEIKLTGEAAKSSKKTSKKEDDEDDEESDEDSETNDDEDEDSEEEDSDEDDDDEEEDEYKKKSSKKKDGKKGKAPPKSAGGDGKPGVIASIVEFLEAATEDKPVSKDKMADKLAKRFPDRDRESMLRTINVQVPGRIKSDKGLNVEKNDKGFWISGKVKKDKK